MSPTFLGRSPNPTVVVFGGRALKEVTGVRQGCKGGALIQEGWRPYEKRSRRQRWADAEQRAHKHPGKGAVCRARGEASGAARLASTSSWGLPTSGPGDRAGLLVRPPSLWGVAAVTPEASTPCLGQGGLAVWLGWAPEKTGCCRCAARWPWGHPCCRSAFPRRPASEGGSRPQTRCLWPRSSGFFFFLSTFF